MGATQLTRLLGGSAWVDISGGSIGIIPEHHTWLITSNTNGRQVTMPPARIAATTVMPGQEGALWTIMVDSASTAANVLLKTSAGLLLATMLPGEVWAVLLRTTDSADGTWRAWREATSYSETTGGAKPSNRTSKIITLTQGTYQHFNLYDHCRTVLGWDGIDPLAITLTIAPGVIRGAESAVYASIDTGRPSGGAWPTGSFLTIINRGVVTGSGGKGGRGADAGTGLSALPGLPGGDALILRMPHAVYDYGTFQGGGGGGGGGIAASSTSPGGGGGGGAGFALGLGGDQGLINGLLGGGAQRGAQATLYGGGAGGLNGNSANQGGNGGNPGSTGAAGGGGGAAGGSGGYAVSREAAFCSAFNWIVGSVPTPNRSF